MKLTQINKKIKRKELISEINSFDEKVVHWAITEVKNDTVTLSVTVVV